MLLSLLCLCSLIGCYSADLYQSSYTEVQVQNVNDDLEPKRISDWQDTLWFAGLMELNNASKWEAIALHLFGNNAFTYPYQYGQTGYNIYNDTSTLTQNISFCTSMDSLFTSGWNPSNNSNIKTITRVSFIVNRASSTQHYCDFAVYFAGSMGDRYIEYRKWDSDYYATTNTSGNVINIFTTNSSKNECVFFGTSNLLYNYFVSDIDSYQQGYDVGYGQGYNAGYDDGYDIGVISGADNPQMTSIFNGIVEIGLLPVNFFLSILNFEVFGINIGGFVTGLLTIAIIVIIARFLFGGKDDK